MTSDSNHDNTSRKGNNDNGNNKNNNTNHNMMVALVDSQVQESWIDRNANVVRLPDPSTSCSYRKCGTEDSYLLDYLQISDGTLFEIQVIGPSPSSTTTNDNESSPTSSYCSYFVGNTVISNGALHVISRIDPLFWVLSTADNSELLDKQSLQWQPLDQILNNYDPILVRALLVDKEQLSLLFQTMKIDSDEDDCYYKFSTTKTLQWLLRKQQQTFQGLLLQRQQKLKQQKKLKKVFKKKYKQYYTGDKAAGGGTISTCHNDNYAAFSSNFILPNDDDAIKTNIHSSESQNHQQQRQNDEPMQLFEQENKERQYQEAVIKKQSIQLICNYLTQEWTDRFLQYMNISRNAAGLPSTEEQLGQTIRKKRSFSSSAGPTTPDVSMEVDDDADDITVQTAAMSNTSSPSRNGGVAKVKNKQHVVTPFNDSANSTTKNNNQNQYLQGLLMGVRNEQKDGSPMLTGSSTTINGKVISNKLKPSGTLSLATKKLSKVNKKGMKSLSTFFSVKKSKTESK